MSGIEERVKKLRELGVRHRIADRIRILLRPAVEDTLDELEKIFMKIELTLPELEGRIKALERRVKDLEDEIAYIEDVMAKNKLFETVAKEVREDAEG